MKYILLLLFLIIFIIFINAWMKDTSFLMKKKEGYTSTSCSWSSCLNDWTKLPDGYNWYYSGYNFGSNDCPSTNDGFIPSGFIIYSYDTNATVYETCSIDNNCTKDDGTCCFGGRKSTGLTVSQGTAPCGNNRFVQSQGSGTFNFNGSINPIKFENNTLYIPDVFNNPSYFTQNSVVSHPSLLSSGGYSGEFDETKRNMMFIDQHTLAGRVPANLCPFTIYYYYTGTSTAGIFGGNGNQITINPLTGTQQVYQLTYTSTGGVTANPVSLAFIPCQFVPKSEGCSVSCGGGVETITSVAQAMNSTYPCWGCDGTTAGGAGGTTTQACNTQDCPPPAPQPPNYTANYNVYTVVDNNPVMLQSQNRLSCVSDDCKTNSGCLAINLGKNMAISFQVTLNKANSTNNWQQIFGITIDPCGTDKRVFGAWLGGPSMSGIYLDTSVITDTNSTEYSTSTNIQALTNFLATVGQNMRVDVLCNFNQQKHEIYVNGSLVETQNFAQGPYFGSGSAYIFSSFTEFQSVDGNIHDLVLLTSDYRTFRIEDLTGATTFVDTDLRGLESFQNIYSPQANGSYSSEDLRGMQTELLQEINNFNQGYSNYMKYMFNQRHNQTGDTTPKMPLYDLSGNPIADSDFAQSDFMNMYANLSESQTYNNLMNDLAVFNQAIKYNAVDMSYNMTSSDINTMLTAENDLVNFRSDLDEKLAELNETENSMFMKNRRNIHAQTFKTLLLTTLATSLVYYVFIHA